MHTCIPAGDVLSEISPCPCLESHFTIKLIVKRKVKSLLSCVCIQYSDAVSVILHVLARRMHVLQKYVAEGLKATAKVLSNLRELQLGNLNELPERHGDGRALRKRRRTCFGLVLDLSRLLCSL